MKLLENVKYTKSHEWILEVEGNKIRIGISDYAQSQLGDIVFVNLPQEGDSFSAEDSFADLESVKAVSDLYSPANGVITAINEEVLDSPEMINEDAFATWLVEMDEVTDYVELLSAEEYKAFCESENE